MPNKAKVGAFTVFGLVLLTGMLFFLSDIHIGRSKEYIIYAKFDQVIGLGKSAIVRLAGVNVGKVIDIETDNRSVRVVMKIRKDVKIPRDSHITVTSSGFLGEKFINIMPGRDELNYIEDGDLIIGHGESGMGAVMDQAGEVIEEAKLLVHSINEIIGSREFKAAMLDSTANVKEITDNVKLMTETFARMSVRNEEEINQIVQNLALLTASLDRSANETERMLRDFSGDGVTAANLRTTVANIAATSARIDNMAKSLEGVVTDPKTSEDLKATLHNIRGVTEKADKMLGGAKSIGVTPGVDIMYSGKRHKYMINFDLRVSMDKNFLLLGANDIGETNKFNAQFGKSAGAFGARAGIIDSKVGIGIDANAGKAFRFSADAYNINRAVLKLRTQLMVAKNTYIIGQIDDVTRRNKRATYIGLRREF